MSTPKPPEPQKTLIDYWPQFAWAFALLISSLLGWSDKWASNAAQIEDVKTRIAILETKVSIFMNGKASN